MDALPKYRHLVFALADEAAYEVHRGRVQEGFDDCFVIRRVGRHLQGRGLLIEQLVGVAIESLAYFGCSTSCTTRRICPERYWSTHGTSCATCTTKIEA